jgi:hypothetical protein
MTIDEASKLRVNAVLTRPLEGKKRYIKIKEYRVIEVYPIEFIMETDQTVLVVSEDGNYFQVSVPFIRHFKDTGRTTTLMEWGA